MKKGVLFVMIAIQCLVSSIVIGQIEEVNFKIDYNSETELFDVKLLIVKGQAISPIDRIQFMSQISIVVPTSSKVSIIESYMPLENNIAYSGQNPMNWIISSSIQSPECQSEFDFYSITPSLGITCAYNNLQEGDEVKLFTLKLESEENCENGIHLFNNNYHPSPFDPGMNGGDYSNAFFLGGNNQIYSGNYTKDFASLASNYSVCKGECIEITPELMCNSTIKSYLWNTGETSYTITVCPDESADFSLKIENMEGEKKDLNTHVDMVEDEDCQLISSTNDIEQIVNIFPNPVQSILNIETNKSIDQLAILSADGKIVYQIDDITQFPLSININHLDTGLYLVKLYGKEINSTETFLKF